ncbi:hypothetical protein RND81_13G083200 [Saponaria officinalis]|uniref:Endonuclease/exonuclease/phosphatase domain-containing protein n=1 Tax=Saponaria officinalis TaxID=3572 RepID=A0AAW1GV47_SAPOF
MKICAWNVRGCNNPLKLKEVSDFFRSNRFDVLGVLETRIRGNNAGRIISSTFRGLAVFCNYEVHSNGRIWLVWNPRNVSVIPLFSHAQCIHCRITHFGTNSSCFSTFVYASNDPATRLSLWNALCSLRPVQEWIVLGDFNVIRDVSERISNVLPNLDDLLDFNACIMDCGLVDLNSCGCEYTWTNNQDGLARVWSKLDRALVNGSWLVYFLSSNVNFLPPGISDHSPALVTSSAMYKLLAKLKNVRNALRIFHKENTSGLHTRLAQAKAALDDSCLSLQASPTCYSLLQSHKKALDTYLKLKSAELSMLYQKAKAEKILQHDSNTRVFYARIKERQHSQTIGEIRDHQGILRTGPAQVIEGFLSYYQHLLGGSTAVHNLDSSIICSGTCLNSNDWPELIKQVSNEEIHFALSSIDPNSSPGADGFSSGFFISS